LTVDHPYEALDLDDDKELQEVSIPLDEHPHHALHQYK